MASVAEHVDDETVEDETTDDDTTEDEETAEDEETTDEEAVEPEAAAPSEKEIERGYAKLDAEATRHANRVSEIMGDAAQALQPCPLCAPSIPGFRWPEEPDEDTKTAVRAALGDLPEQNYKTTDDARICERCDGLGLVLTGSHRPEHKTKPCAGCNGAGWVQVAGPTPTPAIETHPPVAAPPVTPSTEPAPAEDPWGRKVGDPLYGVMPGYEGSRAT